MHICVYVCTYVCMRVCMCIHVCMCMHVCNMYVCWEYERMSYFLYFLYFITNLKLCSKDEACFLKYSFNIKMLL